MKMSLVVDGLRSDVVAVGELGDEVVAEVAERIADVLGRSVPGRVLDLLSDAAAELSATLPDGRVDIRVAGDDVDMTYVEDAPGPTATPTGEGDEQSARITSAPRRGPQVAPRSGRGGRGGLGEHLHCARARAPVEQPEPQWAIACTATARPEGSTDMEKTFETPGGVRLSVEIHAGLVVVTAGPTDRTVVSVEADEPGADGPGRAGHRRVPAVGRPACRGGEAAACTACVSCAATR